MPDMFGAPSALDVTAAAESASGAAPPTGPKAQDYADAPDPKALNLSVQFGSELDPDKAARLLALSKRTGFRDQYLIDNMADVEKEAAAAQFDANSYIKSSPRAAAWLSKNPLYPSIAKPDYAQLGVVEQEMKRVQLQHILNTMPAEPSEDAIKKMAARNVELTRFAPPLNANEGELKTIELQGGATWRNQFKTDEEALQAETDRIHQKRLEVAQEILKSTEKKGFLEAVGTSIQENPLELVPNVLAQAAGAVQQSFRALQRASALRYIATLDEQGVATPEEKYWLTLEALKDQARSVRGSTIPGLVGEIVPAIPGFGARLTLTRGAYTGAKRLISSLPGVGIQAGEDVVTRGFRRALAAIGASAVQTIASSPLEIATIANQRMTPKGTLEKNPATGRIDYTITKDSGESWTTAWPKAFADQFTEVSTERLGGTALFKFIDDRGPGQILYKAFRSLHPGETAEAFQRWMKHAGIHGVLGEMGEERAGEVMKAAFRVEAYKFPSSDQLLAELISFSVPGVAHGTLTHLNEASLGKAEEERFQRLVESLMKVEMGKRSPEELLKFHEHLTKDTESEFTYIDPKTWKDYFQQKGGDPSAEAKTLLGSSEAYDRAIEGGSLMQIPTARYNLIVAPSEHGKFFASEIKASPEGMNGREARAFFQTDSGENTPFTPEDGGPPTTPAQVRDRLKAEVAIAAEISRDVERALRDIGVPAQQARTDASITAAQYIQRARILEVSPAQLYQEEGPNIMSNLPAGGGQEAAQPIQPVHPAVIISQRNALRQMPERKPGESPEGFRQRFAKAMEEARQQAQQTPENAPPAATAAQGVPEGQTPPAGEQAPQPAPAAGQEMGQPGIPATPFHATTTPIPAYFQTPIVPSWVNNKEAGARYLTAQQLGVNPMGANVDVRTQPITLMQKMSPELRSKLLEVAAKTPQAMPVQHLRTWLSKNGVKREEMIFTGLDAWLNLHQNDKITKEMLLNFVQQNQVKTTVTILGQEPPAEIKAKVEAALEVYTRADHALMEARNDVGAKIAEKLTAAAIARGEIDPNSTMSAEDAKRLVTNAKSRLTRFKAKTRKAYNARGESTLSVEDNAAYNSRREEIFAAERVLDVVQTNKTRARRISYQVTRITERPGDLKLAAAAILQHAREQGVTPEALFAGPEGGHYYKFTAKSDYEDYKLINEADPAALDRLIELGANLVTSRGAYSEAKRLVPDAPGTTFGAYETPGPGRSGYREMLVAIEQPRPDFMDEAVDFRRKMELKYESFPGEYQDSSQEPQSFASFTTYERLSPDEKRKWDAYVKRAEAGGATAFYSSHWRGRKDIVLHVRYDVRNEMPAGYSVREVDILGNEGPSGYFAGFDASGARKTAPMTGEPAASAALRELGEPVFFINEIQSDWHQKGRELGYATPELDAKVEKARLLAQEKAMAAEIPADEFYTLVRVDEQERIARELGTDNADIVMNEYEIRLAGGHGGLSKLAKDAEEHRRVSNSYKMDRPALEAISAYRELKRTQVNAIPNAPYSDTKDWVSLALKHSIQQAALDGHTRIAISNGVENALLYKDVLMNHYSVVSVKPSMGRPGMYAVSATQYSGGQRQFFVAPANSPAYAGGDTLEDVVGDGLAARAVRELGARRSPDTEARRNVISLGEQRVAAQAELDAASAELNPFKYKDHGGDRTTAEYDVRQKVAVEKQQVFDRINLEYHRASRAYQDGAIQAAFEYVTYRGTDLKIGSEGMKTFYDKIVPSVTKDLIAPYDSSLETSNISFGTSLATGKTRAKGPWISFEEGAEGQLGAWVVFNGQDEKIGSFEKKADALVAMHKANGATSEGDAKLLAGASPNLLSLGAKEFEQVNDVPSFPITRKMQTATFNQFQRIDLPEAHTEDLTVDDIENAKPMAPPSRDLLQIHEEGATREATQKWLDKVFGKGSEASKRAFDELYGKPEFQDLIDHLTANQEAYLPLATPGTLMENTDKTYKVTVDLTGVCVRILRAIAVRKYVSAKVPGASKELLRGIENELNKAGFELTCVYCYTMTRKIKSGEKLDATVVAMNKKSFDFLPLGEGISGDKLALVKFLWPRALKEMKQNPGWEKELRALPELLQSKTAKGVEVSAEATAFDEKHPNIRALIQEATDPGNMKTVKGAVALTTQILNLKMASIERALKFGGLRWQSNMDFVPENTLDYIYGIWHMGFRGIPGHIYTKQIALARLLGGTGLKINMSTAPLIVDGKVVWEKGPDGEKRPAINEGIGATPWKYIDEAMALDPDHVGPMVLGLNHEILQWAMTSKSKYATYVIPWHSSGMTAEMSKVFRKANAAHDYGQSHEEFKVWASKEEAPKHLRPILVKREGTAEYPAGWVTDIYRISEVLPEMKPLQDYLTLLNGDAPAIASIRKNINLPPALIMDMAKGESDEAATKKYFDYVEKLGMIPVFTHDLEGSGIELNAKAAPYFWRLKKHYARTDTEFAPPDVSKVNFVEAKKLAKEYEGGTIAKAISGGASDAMTAYARRELDPGEAAAIDSAIQLLKDSKDPEMQAYLNTAKQTPGGRTLMQAHAASQAGLAETRAMAFTSPAQGPTSAGTCVSYGEGKTPKLFSSPDVAFGKVNADIGGGSGDAVTAELAKRGTKNLVWDPYNREAAHNEKVQAALAAKPADTATLSNVLNVIKEREGRLAALATAYASIKDGGKAYIATYNSGKAGETSKGYQMAKPTEFYLPEVEAVFGKGNVAVENGMIVATKVARDLMQGVTPEQDAAHLAAVESGDMATAQKMVDEAAKAAGYVVGKAKKVKPLYHSGDLDVTAGPPHTIPEVGPSGFHFGTEKAAEERPYGKHMDDFEKDLVIYESDPNPRTGEPTYHWKSMGWSSEDNQELGFSDHYSARDSADLYRGMYADSMMEGGGGFRTTKAYLSIKNPKRVSDQKQDWAKVVAEAKSEGHDGLVYRNDYEDAGKDSYVVFNASQIKSSDPVTRDNQGRVIPLSERFGVTGDIRFSRIEGATPSRDYNETARGVTRFYPGGAKPDLALLKKMNASTYRHEMVHVRIEEMARDVAMLMARDPATLTALQQQYIKDAQTLADYAGAQSLSGLTDAQHEKLAEAGEVYFLKGKAPSKALEGAFYRIKKWLVDIYRGHRLMNVELSQDVTSVFDRWIATQEEIDAARNQQHMASFVEDAVSLGLSGDAAEAWANALADAQAAAYGDLEKQMMASLERKDTAEYKAKMAEVRAEVEKRVSEDKAFRLQHIVAILQGEDPAQKINRRELEIAYPDVDTKGFPRGIWANDSVNPGMHPDMAAEMFGYQDARSLLAALRTAQPTAQIVEDLVDAKMKELYPDPMASVEQRRAAAQEAIHSEKQAILTRKVLEHMVSENFAAFKKMAKRVAGGIPSDAAMKQNAREMISKMKVREIRPDVFLRAERAANKEAQEFFYAGKFQEAFESLRRALLNNNRYREAVAARNGVQKALVSFRRMLKPDEKLAKTRDVSLVKAAHAILFKYGIGGEKTDASEYLRQAEAYAPQLKANMDALIADASVGATPYKEATYGAFATMEEAVDALWSLSRRAKQVTVAGQVEELDEVHAKIAARMVELGGRASAPGYAHQVTKWEKVKLGLMGWKAALTRVEAWVNTMDGGKMNGPFRTYFWRPVSEAAANYREDTHKRLAQYEIMVRALEKDLPAGRIDAPEIGYTFGYESGNGAAELVGALMHRGNQSNFYKLLVGRGWGSLNADGTLDSSRWDAFEKRMHEEGKLGKIHYDFVQGVWNMFEDMKPQLQKAHHEMFGYYFDEVTRDAFVTPFGQYEGGYAPAKVDPFVSVDASRREEKNALEQQTTYSFPSTGRGSAKKRMPRYAGPLTLDLRFVQNHIDWAMRFAHLEPVVRDVAKLVMHGPTHDALDRFDPAAVTDMLVPWLTRAAQQRVMESSKGNAGRAVDAVANWIRTKTGAQIMVGNIANVVQQYTGLSITLTKVRHEFIRDALWEYTRGPKEMGASVSDRSVYMRHRLNSFATEIRGTIDEIMLNPTKYQQVGSWTRDHGHFFQQATQSTVDTISWVGAYNQAIADKKSEAEATDFADSVIRLTQGSGAPEDVSAFEAGTPFKRLFTQFTGYFNMQANLLGSEFAITGRELGVRKGAGRLLYVYTTGFMIPAVLSEVLSSLFRGAPPGDDQDPYMNAWLALFFGAQFRTGMAMVPGGGLVSKAIAGGFTAAQYDDRIQMMPSVSILEQAAHAPGDVYRMIEGNMRPSTAIRDWGALSGMITGLPIEPVAKPIGYLVDWEQGKRNPQNAWDATTGILTGKGTGK